MDKIELLVSLQESTNLENETWQFKDNGYQKSGFETTE